MKEKDWKTDPAHQVENMMKDAKKMMEQITPIVKQFEHIESKQCEVLGENVNVILMGNGNLLIEMGVKGKKIFKEL